MREGHVMSIVVCTIIMFLVRVFYAGFDYVVALYNEEIRKMRIDFFVIFVTFDSCAASLYSSKGCLK